MIQYALQDSITDITNWCHNNKMALNPKKSKSMVVATRQKHQLQPLSLTLTIGNEAIEQVKVHRVLGVLVDEKLTWHFHIDAVLKTVSRNLFLLNKLWHYVSTDALKTFFYAHCLSHINYASSLWCNSDDDHLKKINKLHKRAVKLLYRKHDVSVEDRYKHLEILTLRDQFNYNECVMLFKQSHDLLPNYLQKLLPKQNSRTLDFVKPLRTSRLHLTQSGYIYSSVSAWNNLPRHCKAKRSLGTFKTALRQHYLTTPTYW